MPYKLRKQPKKDLYWVVNKETGHKHSKDALPKEKAIAQMKALYAAEGKEGGFLGSLGRAAVTGVKSLGRSASRVGTKAFTAATRYAAANPVKTALAKTALSGAMFVGVPIGLQKWSDARMQEQNAALSQYYDTTTAQQDKALQEQITNIEAERKMIEDAKIQMQKDYERQVKADAAAQELANQQYAAMRDEQQAALMDYLASLRAELLSYQQPARTYDYGSSSMPTTSYTPNPTQPTSAPTTAPATAPVDLSLLNARQRAQYKALYGYGKKSDKLGKKEKAFLVDAMCDLLGHSRKEAKAILKENGF